MLLHGGDALHSSLVGMYNSMISDGEFDPSWKETVFVMHSKAGDLEDPVNWRPIAFLRVCYKLFARIMYNRIRVPVDAQQSEDQMGFRTKRGTDDALSILESVIGKCIEFNVPMWLASLDLRKAFDRIEWPQLFASLQEQGLPLGYRNVLRRLYCGQCGLLASGEEFPILRGVRQGDVLSPLLFNAGLEHAVRRWKKRLSNTGIVIDGGERRTNVRFADDLIIYAHNAKELGNALQMLAEELKNIGLDLNAKKTKIFTNDPTVFEAEKPVHIKAGDAEIEVMRTRDVHKYLGAAFRGDLTLRGKANLAHRMHCAWAKFHQYKAALTSNHVAIPLRLKLFEATITSCILYGLTTSPLTACDVGRLGVVQRKMMRRIIGGIPCNNNDWSDYHRRQNARMAAALDRFPIQNWEERLREQKRVLKAQLDTGTRCALAVRVHSWYPPSTFAAAHRNRGHPRTRWYE